MNAADKLLMILGLFDENRPGWTAEALTMATGFSRPTLYRYLKSLRGAGLLTSQGGVYRLGPRVTEMDWLMRRSDPVLSLGGGALKRLAAHHPGTAFLVRWYGQRVLCIASEVSAAAPRSSYPRGRPMPLSRGAASRAILAWLPRRALDEIGGPGLLRLRAKGETENQIRRTLRQVRRDGIAEARGEVTPGVLGLAAPIFDGQLPVAALCFTAETAETDPPAVARLRALILAEAGRIGERIDMAENWEPA